MVLSGWDAAKKKADRCFVTHYGVIGALTAAEVDVQCAEKLCAADHVHIAGFYNFKALCEVGSGLDRILAACRAAGCTTSRI